MSRSRIIPQRGVEVKLGKIGRGVFATRLFLAGDTVMHITGRIVDATELTEAGGTYADNAFRFGPETYLQPGDGEGRYLNHSCDPNAAVRKRANRLYLVAVKRIPAGSEVTIDYSTILGDDDIWVMRCKCNTQRCRKTIRRFGSLAPPLRRRYIQSGMVPRYIIDTLGWHP